jgi:hypothetical protein
MIMKKIIYTGLVIFTTLSFWGCESFLDSQNYTKKDSGNVPTTVKDAEQMLTGIYSTLQKAVEFPVETHFYMAELASDERFGGGGENDKDMQGLDRLMNTKPDRFANFWSARYQGIYRANLAITGMDKCIECTDDQKKQFLGEAYFLRALFYFELAQMFGEVPLVITTEPVNLPKASADEIYAQIAYDLIQAIDLMYNRPSTAAESGHATKWAAEALMARVFLFYTGYYNKESISVAGESGGSVTKTQVISWLEDCISNSGHGLISDFRNLWPYGNEFTNSDYKYAKDNNLLWAGDGNKETVFAIKFSIKGAWGNENSIGQSNQLALHFGLRGPNGEVNTFPYGVGWGAGTVNTILWSDWRSAEPNDIRRVASILDITTELADYSWGADNQMEETGFWQKKYMPIKAYNKQTGKLDISYSVQKDNYQGGDYQLANTQDLVLIRFADVLLMHSELKQDAANLNLVRARVGLPAVGYSLDAIKRERRFELAFEGLRWFDIMRWGDAPALLAKQEGVSFKNKNVDAVNKAFGGGYKARYEATGGFWPIPETQISLSEGVLLQNKGWGIPEAEFTGW